MDMICMGYLSCTKVTHTCIALVWGNRLTYMYTRHVNGTHNHVLHIQNVKSALVVCIAYVHVHVHHYHMHVPIPVHVVID